MIRHSSRTPAPRLIRFTVGHTLTAHPLDADCYYWPATMAAECQSLADHFRRNVSFTGRNSGDRHLFTPNPMPL